MQSIQSGQNSGQGTGVSVPTLQEATPNTGRGDQTALQMKVSSAPAPLPAFRFATEESAKPPDARNVDAQSNQYLFAVWKQCPSSDIPCAQRAANLLQAYAGESVENCPVRSMPINCGAIQIRKPYRRRSAPERPEYERANVRPDRRKCPADARPAVRIPNVLSPIIPQGPSPEIQNIIQNTEEGTLSSSFCH